MMIPVDIVIQTVLSLILTMTGVLFIAGDFKVRFYCKSRKDGIRESS